MKKRSVFYLYINMKYEWIKGLYYWISIAIEMQ